MRRKLLQICCHPVDKALALSGIRPKGQECPPPLLGSLHQVEAPRAT